MKLLKLIAPEVLEIVERRYAVLRSVYFMSPVGRRALAERLDLTERCVRNELAFLQERGLLISTPLGMEVTTEGQDALNQLKDYVRELHGLANLERELARVLGIPKVIVVPGDSDSNELIKQDMAKAAARYLKEVLRSGQILAVTGGSTLKLVADLFPQSPAPANITVVSARGGLGENVNLQANTIAAKLAEKLGGQYRLLYAPDDVPPGLINTIMREPSIREVIGYVRRSNVLLHGIGTAEEMARRRRFDDDRLMELIADGAVGEAFGYYFNSQGKIVYSTSSVGIRLQDLDKIPLVIAVGGGKSKAWAVLSVVSTGYCDMCITDEGAARRLMTIVNKNKEE